MFLLSYGVCDRDTARSRISRANCGNISVGPFCSTTSSADDAVVIRLGDWLVMRRRELIGILAAPIGD
jgi:hypothetical protein